MMETTNYLAMSSPEYDGIEVRWYGGGTFNVFSYDTEVDVFTFYGDHQGNAPSLEQARDAMDRYFARLADDADAD